MSSTLLPQFDGYVTTYASVGRKSAPQLERSLGFNAGALSTGFSVYELVAPVARADFEWKDRTRYSAGWHFDSSIDEYVQRYDELRAHLGKNNNWNEAATDRLLDRFMADHLRRLNIRHGPERIVKVVPRDRAQSYPDSRLSHIPQWRLTNRKVFRLFAEVPPGQHAP